MNVLKRIWQRIGVFFGLRCPKCYSKKFWTHPVMMFDRNGCHDCGHEWTD